MRSLPLLTVLLLAVFLFGCTLPIEQETAKMEVAFSSSGSFTQKSITEGKLVEGVADEWEGDCTEKFSAEIGRLLVLMNLSKSESSPDSALGETTDAEEFIKIYLKNLSCSFSRQETRGTLTFENTLSFEDVQRLSKLLGEMESAPETRQLNKLSASNENSVFEFTVPISATTGSALVDELKVKVEGELIELSPSGYTEENGQYVYSSGALRGKETLHIKYRPVAFTFFQDFWMFLPLLLIAVFVFAVLIHYAFKHRPPPARKDFREKKEKFTKQLSLPSLQPKKTKAIYVDFVQEYFKRGYSVQQIRNALLKGGVSKEETEQAISEALKGKMV